MLAGLKGKVTCLLLLILVVVSLFILGNGAMAVAPVDVDKLLPGDILFVDIYDGWCFYGYWDHLALYVGEQEIWGYKIPAVIEATYDTGICLTPLKSFLERDAPAEVAVKRLKKDIPQRDKVIQEAIDYALDQQGKPFDTLIVPLHKIGDKRFHCTEIIWRAYQISEVDLDSIGTIFLFPDDVYYSPYLELINGT